MISSTRTATAFQRGCVAAVTAALLLQPMAAYPVTLVNSYLSETPLQGFNPVKPNIVFTADDSGSMAFEYLPDYAAEGPTNTAMQIYYCRDGTHCGGVANSLIGPWVITVAHPPVRSSNHNRQFYDPAATYLPGRRADGTNLPYEATAPGTFTAVYPNGYANYPNTNSSTPVNLVTGYPDTAWCTVLASNAADFATAFTNGSMCRLNGRAYPASTDPTGLWRMPSVSAGYNYPNTRDNTSTATLTPTLCAAADEKCVFNVPITVFGNPYYYTITRVQFCAVPDALGFGASSCVDRWDQNVNKYIRYGTNPALSLDPQAFARIDIVPTTTTYPSGRTYAAEMANFAKWYTFYRDRVSALKSAGGLAFSNLSQDEARIGLHTLHENATLFQNVAPFNTAQKNAWFNKFYAVTPSGGTPLPDAVFRIGEYFRDPASSGLPGAVEPLDASNGMCQQNYHLLATDGYWNSGLATGSVGDRDLTVPTSIPTSLEKLFTAGAPFPRPYYEGPTPTSNSLADLAMYYWITDLRPSLQDKVDDTLAPWQHVTLYGVSQGAQGNFVYRSGGVPPIEVMGDPTAIPAVPPGNWPPALGAGGPESVDDLWHAALNSQGEFATAQDPQELARTIINWINKLTSAAGTGTGVGIAGAQFTPSRSFGYRTSYEKGWWGDVKKYALDPDTGALPVNASGGPRDAPVWSAALQLDQLAQGSGWDTNRRILTINDSNAGVPFRFNNLSPAQQNSLNAGWIAAGVTPPSQQAIFDYLRGDRQNEGLGATSLRIRTHVLGDIVYSGAVPVGAPEQPYLDAGNPGYEDFKRNNASRTPMVYVGANDGMVHAFDDSVANGGTEVWAYVPRVLFNNGNPNETGATSDPAYQLGALAYSVLPPFQHRFYVNSTARAWDVDFTNAGTPTVSTSGNRWRTILVGGLGAGGRAVYALDITAPPVSTDTEASIAATQRVLWEFTDPELGYVFDPPTLVKTLAYGWVVLVNSGYNNDTGNGVLFVLNPKDGTILKKLKTGVGSITDQSGLSTIRAYTASRRDPIALQVYGGDLKGNVWRFDLSDPNPGNWRDADLIAKLRDSGGNEQPITTGVRVEIDQNNNVDRYIFVGTGKLLGVNNDIGVDDINSSSVVNSLYVIRDGTRLVPDPKPTTPYSRSNLNAVDGTSVAGFSGTPTGRGWYQDATDPKEKVGTDVFADVQTVVFAFSKPTNEPCASPLASRLYARDFTNGASVLVQPGGGIIAGYDITSGIAGVQLIQGQPGSGGTSMGEIRALVTTMKGEVFSFAISPPATPAARHRVSWRLLNKN